jgi:hypothetical protein
LVVAVSVFYFMPKSQTSEVKIASKKQTPQILSPKKNTDNIQVEKITDNKKKEESTSVSATEKNVPKPIKKIKEKENVQEEKSIEPSIAFIEEKLPVESVETAPVEQEKTSDPIVADVQSKSSHVTIVITSTEADEKYLDKKSLAEATSEEKKSSTLRKLLDTAYDLKNNQDPFGDLRQKKNEILALNFKSEKQRSQNK